MKKHALIVVMQIALGVMPVIALAAYNDVRLTVSTTSITVGGISLVLVGNADLDSITVDSSTLTLIMTEGSYLSVTSADRRVISTSNVGSIKVTSGCTDSLSSYTYESPAGAPSSTITLTIESGTCATSGGSGSPGGGGGSSGGGASYIYVPPTTQTAATVKAAPKAIVSAPAAVSAISANITRALAKGATNPQVRVLQQILNSDPETRISATGIGSLGNETNFFGPATLKAIQKFQVKHGIARPGVEGYGVLGPKTRAKLNELGAGVKTIVSPAQTTAVQKKIDDAMKQIQILQEQLKKAK